MLRIALPVSDDRDYRNYFVALSALGAAGVAVGGDADPAGFDGMLLPGGGDIDPARYHRANTDSVGIDEALDEMQFSALDAFVKAEKPVLGICRGHQLVNVYFGGTLIQHLDQAPDHSRGDGSEDKVHDTAAVPGSALHRLYGPRFAVNSLHHQGVDAVGKGLLVIQRADDGVIEGMAHETLPILTVQWHPERMCFALARRDTVDGSRILERFLVMCRG